MTTRLHPSSSLLSLAIAAALLASCSTVSAEDPPRKPHHRPGGFQNNYLDFVPKTFGELLRWKLDASRDDLPRPPRTPTPTVTPDTAFIQANGRADATAMQPTITWIGHATMLAQLGGLNVITDPAFSERVSPLSFVGPKRHAAPGLAITQLPHIDLVLISHNHYDHLDDASVRALAQQAGGPAGRRCSSYRSASSRGWPSARSQTWSNSTGGNPMRWLRPPARSKSCSRRFSTGQAVA